MHKKINGRITKQHHGGKICVLMYLFRSIDNIPSEVRILFVFNFANLSRKKIYDTAKFNLFTFATGGLSGSLLGTSHGCFQRDIIGISMENVMEKWQFVSLLKASQARQCIFKRDLASIMG